jgi:hypothetical protein
MFHRRPICERGQSTGWLRERVVRGLWILVSVMWIVFWAWQRNIVCELNLPLFGWGPRCLVQFYDLVLHAGTLAVLFGPPALVGFVGWTAFGGSVSR